MMPEMPSSRQRAGHRRTLYLLVGGLAAAAACFVIKPSPLAPPAPQAEAASPGAPPEAAIRPNDPTEPVLGLRVSGPGG